MHFGDLLIAVWLHNEIKRLSWYKRLRLCSSRHSKPSLEVSRRNSSSRLPHQLSPIQDGRHRKVRPRICRKLRTLPFHSWWVLFAYSCYCMSPKNNIIEVKECARKGEKNILLPISWESSLLSTGIASTLVFSKRPFLLKVNLKF